MNEHFDVNQMNNNFDVNCAIIHNPGFEILHEVVEKLKNQGLEIRIILTPDDYEFMHDLKNVNFDIIELNPYEGNVKAKNKAVVLKKGVEIFIKETDVDEVNRMLWNIQHIKKVFVKKELEGRIKKYDNVVYF